MTRGSRAPLRLKEIRGIFAHLQIVEVVPNAALASIVPTYRRSRCPVGRDNRQTNRRSRAPINLNWLRGIAPPIDESGL